jgi:hypothetical protein
MLQKDKELGIGRMDALLAQVVSLPPPKFQPPTLCLNRRAKVHNGRWRRRHAAMQVLLPKRRCRRLSQPP